MSNSQKGFAPIIIILGIVLLLGVFGGVYYFGISKNTPVLVTPKACTQEAKICPDGSAVGRTGPNCEFSPCPITSPAKATDETVNWKLYKNPEFKFSFSYPSNWLLEDNYQHISLYPNGFKNWEPKNPEDIDKDPNINIYFGNYATEMLPDFPKDISRETVKQWTKSNLWEDGMVETNIDDQAAIKVIEKRIPDCDIAYYLRPIDLNNLIRASVHCSSISKEIFDQILSTFKFTN